MEQGINNYKDYWKGECLHYLQSLLWNVVWFHWLQHVSSFATSNCIRIWNNLIFACYCELCRHSYLQHSLFSFNFHLLCSLFRKTLLLFDPLICLSFWLFNNLHHWTAWSSCKSFPLSPEFWTPQEYNRRRFLTY